MAERRMFAKSIIDSDMFSNMPLEAQMLYIRLNLAADDDGFVSNPRQVMRMCGASDDCMRLLVAKKFVISFEVGDDFVFLIKHWKIHNYLRSDRYKASTFKNLLRDIYYDENKAYSQSPGDGKTPCIPQTVSEPYTDGIPTVYQAVDNRYPQERKGKDSIGKDSIGQSIEGDPFETFWNVYPKKVGKEAAREAFSKCTQPLDLLVNAIEKQKQSVQWNKENGRYIPNPATWLSQGRWSDEVEAVVGKATATADSPSFRKDVADFMEGW